jgi:crotonobetainyl-CoA:carnitine CoA-transferase CaiB-like acyl-CoA transferase
MQEGLLEGIRILDLSQAGVGPLTGAVLADYGATVISIEPPGGGSQRRLAQESVRANYLRNKRSIEVNLKANGSDKIVSRLVESADALIHNYPPETAERLGCDYESLKMINQELVYCSVTGYGEDGPYSDRLCLDPHAQAMSGLMWNTGEPDRKPSRVGVSLISFATAQMAAFGIAGALWNRDRSGEGQKIEASLFDTAGAAMGYWYTYNSLYDEAPTRQGHSWEGYSPAGVIETNDDPIYLAIPFQQIWKRFCKVMDREEWIDDPRFKTDEDRLENREELLDAIEKVCSSYPREELIEKLVAAGIPISEVQTIPEAARDKHLDARGAVTDIEDVDGTVVRGMGTALSFSRTPGGVVEGPPRAGEHTFEVLSEVGFDQEQIEQLQDDDIVSAPETS